MSRLDRRLNPTCAQDWAEVERFFLSVVALDGLAGRQLSRRDRHAMRACARVARGVKEGLQELRRGQS